jgi:hypothetical protein
MGHLHEAGSQKGMNDGREENQAPNGVKGINLHAVSKSAENARNLPVVVFFKRPGKCEFGGVGSSRRGVSQVNKSKTIFYSFKN